MFLVCLAPPQGLQNGAEGAAGHRVCLLVSVPKGCHARHRLDKEVPSGEGCGAVTPARMARPHHPNHAHPRSLQRSCHSVSPLEKLEAPIS